MTKTQIALSAIKSLPFTGTVHIEVNSIMRALSMDTPEAVELVDALRAEKWAASLGSEQFELFDAAKEAANVFARNIMVR